MTGNSRYLGDSGADGGVTDNRDIGDCHPHTGDHAIGSSATSSRKTGDWGPVLETVDVRDMGDARASWLADALENDVSHG